MNEWKRFWAWRRLGSRDDQPPSGRPLPENPLIALRPGRVAVDGQDLAAEVERRASR